jgi:Domain of Unknown Function (DUF1907)
MKREMPCWEISTALRVFQEKYNIRQFRLTIKIQLLKVLEIECKKRIGGDDFIASIRKTLDAKYGAQAVGKFSIG